MGFYPFQKIDYTLIKHETNSPVKTYHFPFQRNKTIKDGDIAPWKDLQKKLNKDKKKRTKKKLYFDMGRLVKR